MKNSALRRDRVRKRKNCCEELVVTVMKKLHKEIGPQRDDVETEGAEEK
jgi:hypothetical protein